MAVGMISRKHNQGGEGGTGRLTRGDDDNRSLIERSDSYDPEADGFETPEIIRSPKHGEATFARQTTVGSGPPIQQVTNMKKLLWLPIGHSIAAARSPWYPLHRSL